MSLTDEVKEFARKNRADLVGVASADRFQEAPDGRRPWDLLPDAKSVIVMAKRIPISVVKTIPSPHYNTCCSYLNEQLRVLAYKTALFMEDRGFEALPIDPSISDYARDVEIIREQPAPEIKMLGNFSHRHAAVIAGLGEISVASYVVVPKFGPRVRFVSVISTAPLKPDPRLKEDMKWGLICKPETCRLACVKACPPGALLGDGMVSHFKCRSYRDPKIYNLEYFKEIAKPSYRGISPIRKISILSRTHPTSNIETCGVCIKACPIGITI
jgi:epoxyqueuosine reductase QueG